jgi:ribonuclease P protein component
MRRSGDIERVKRTGRRISTAFFNVLVSPSQDASSRFGVVAGKRLGGAIQRNRAKRLFRELIRGVHNEVVEGHECLVFPKRDALAVPFQTLRSSWLSMLRRQGLLRPDAVERCDSSVSQ